MFSLFGSIIIRYRTLSRLQEAFKYRSIRRENRDVVVFAIFFMKKNHSKSNSNFISRT